MKNVIEQIAKIILTKWNPVQDLKLVDYID